MALEYKTKEKRKTENRIENLLAGMPEFVSIFIQASKASKSENTLISYTRDLKAFFEYLTTVLEKQSSVEDISVSDLSSLELKDFKDYETFLIEQKKSSNSTIKRNMSSISSLYKHLIVYKFAENNPLENYDAPKITTSPIVYLNGEQTTQLLEGILSNNLKLSPSNNNNLINEKKEADLVPTEMSGAEQLLKEKNVLRDYAIVTLFLGTGLRLSELVGIDLEDIDFEEQSILVTRKGKGMSTEKVFFGKEVSDALNGYINGAELPDDILLDKPENFLDFCIANATKEDAIEKAQSIYGEQPESFYSDIERACYAVRNPGRSGFLKSKRTDALFLSSRGDRISGRMVENIVKEKVLLYLPDLKDKHKISPHKLRSTAATRLLSQTNDILLVSKQLGHASPAVTSKHYAQLQEDKEKARLANLEITDW